MVKQVKNNFLNKLKSRKQLRKISSWINQLVADFYPDDHWVFIDPVGDMRRNSLTNEELINLDLEKIEPIQKGNHMPSFFVNPLMRELITVLDDLHATIQGQKDNMWIISSKGMKEIEKCVDYCVSLKKKSSLQTRQDNEFCKKKIKELEEFANEYIADRDHFTEYINLVDKFTVNGNYKTSKHVNKMAIRDGENNIENKRINTFNAIRDLEYAVETANFMNVSKLSDLVKSLRGKLKVNKDIYLTENAICTLQCYAEFIEAISCLDHRGYLERKEMINNFSNAQMLIISYINKEIDGMIVFDIFRCR